MKKLLVLVGRLLFNYSSYPLKILTTAGGVIALCSFIWGIYAITRQLFFGVSVEGWTTLVALLSFLNGFVIIMLGVLGEYIIRLLRTVSSDKAYQISKEVNN